MTRKKLKAKKEIREINKSNLKKRPKNPSEGSKPLLRRRTHGNDNKPLPPIVGL